MVVPGVLNGSKGPLLYTPEEIARDPTAWNGVPITLGHPSENGRAISARIPRILDRFAIGQVFNVDFRGKRLCGDAYFDEDLCRRRAPEILSRLRSGQRIELSTGLFTDNEPAECPHYLDRWMARRISSAGR